MAQLQTLNQESIQKLKPSAFRIHARPRRWEGSHGVRIEPFHAGTHEGVAFVAPPGSQVRSRAGAVPFRRAREARVRLAVTNASSEHPVTLYFDFYHRDRTHRWGKLVRFTDSGWKTVRVRLPKTSYGAHVAAPWSEVSSWGMRFQNAARVQLQAFELRDADPLPALRLGLALLDTSMGTPPSLKAGRAVARVRKGGLPSFDAGAALSGFVALHRSAREQFPGLPDFEREVPLLVVSSSAALHSVWSVFTSAVGVSKHPAKTRYDWMRFVTGPQSHSWE